MAAQRRVAFVTGASRGIGAATAQALARRGFDVVVTARTLTEGERHEHGPHAGRSDTRPLPGSLERTAAAVRACGREALPLRLDLLEPDSLDAALEAAETGLGPIEVLVNNGIYQGPGVMDRVLDLRADDLAKIFTGNVASPLRLIQRVLPGMLARGHGSIVNLVSASAESDPPAPTGEGGWGWGYAASKAALLRLAGVLAVEHAGTGVHFHNVEPGFILTEMLRESGMAAEFAGRFRGAPPEVPAAAIAWLASDPAAADEWHGRTLHAQKVAARQGLVPGWPPQRDA